MATMSTPETFAEIATAVATKNEIRSVEDGFYWKEHFVPFTVDNFRIRFGFSPEEIGTHHSNHSSSSASSFVLLFYFCRNGERTIESFPISQGQYKKISRVPTHRMMSQLICSNRKTRFHGLKPTTRIEKKVLSLPQKFEKFIDQLVETHLEALNELKDLKKSSDMEYWKALRKVNNQSYGVYAFEILLQTLSV